MKFHPRVNSDNGERIVESVDYNTKALIEAALFLSENGVSVNDLVDLTGLDREGVENKLKELERVFGEESRGLQLFKTPEGKYRLKVKRAYVDRVKHLAPHQDLSQAILRTLSVIAYNTPVLQKEIIEIRGNGAYAHIDELIERGFVQSEKEGRTKLLSVTDEFLRYFEIEDPKQLKEEL